MSDGKTFTVIGAGPDGNPCTCVIEGAIDEEDAVVRAYTDERIHALVILPGQPEVTWIRE